MKFKFFSIIIFASANFLTFAGCGAGGPGSPIDKKVESQRCIDCHEQNPISISSVTGKDVTVEFQASSHYTTGKVSCNDCHEKSGQHPESCIRCHGGSPPISVAHSTPLDPIQASPATASHPTLPAHTPKCFKCHFLPSTYTKVDTMTNQVRLNHISSAKTLPGKASYLPYDSSTTYANSCNRCHNPHNNSSGNKQAREWAASGKGDVTAGPWGYSTSPTGGREFRLNGVTYAAVATATTPAIATIATIATIDHSIAYNQCVRCHTTTGYLNFIGQGNSQLPLGSIRPFGQPVLNQGKETLFCNACHSDYSYARRNTGPVTVFYTFSGNTTDAVPKKIRLNGTDTPEIRTDFKNIGTSNLCLWCHTGRETGEVIKIVAKDPTVNFDKLPIILSHYLTGGSSLLQSNGYTFTHLDPLRTYPAGGHQDVGMTDIYGGSARGPCITCHMKPSRHTFEPLSTSKASATNFWLNNVRGLTTACTGCHSEYSAQNIDNKKIAHKAALDAVLGNLTSSVRYRLKPGQANNIRSFSNRAPLSGTFVSWSTSGGRATKKKIRGPDLMGAAFNWVSLVNDYGSYVHNVPYAKKLMYDTIDLLDNGDLDFSTCTKLESGPAYDYLCTKGKTPGFITERP